jgi:hypothetical protein
MSYSSSDDYCYVSNHGIAEVRQKKINQQNALFSLKEFLPGDLIADFSAGAISAEPTYLTVQLGKRKHITLQPDFLQYINHSCDPNVFFDTTLMKLVALKTVSPNEELVFFYPSTEWKMDQGFHCFCGHSHCLGEIRGAAFIAKQILKQYRLSDFIQQELSKRTTRKVA